MDGGPKAGDLPAGGGRSPHPAGAGLRRGAASGGSGAVGAGPAPAAGKETPVDRVGVDMCCAEPVGAQPPYLRHPLGTDRRSADVPCLLPGTLVLCHPAGCIHLGGPGSADPGADGLYLAGLEKEKTRKRAAFGYS